MAALACAVAAALAATIASTCACAPASTYASIPAPASDSASASTEESTCSKDEKAGGPCFICSIWPSKTDSSIRLLAALSPSESPMSPRADAWSYRS